MRESKPRLRLIRLCTLLISIFILTSSLQFCAAPTKKNPWDIVSTICEKEKSLPSGIIYSTSADEESDEFLSPRLLLAAYAIPSDFDGIESAAVWLSKGMHPSEFAVVLCKDGRRVEDVAMYFKNKLAMLQKNAPHASAVCGMTPELYASYISEAQVCISGRYVALLISSDAVSARRAFLGSL